MLARREENRENYLTMDPEIKCYMPGVPRANYQPHPFQIFQSESAFFIAYSFAGAVRNIFLEDPGPAPVDSWMGQSFGYWEGDTWVVEVTGQDERTWFDRAGNFHSYEMKVTERWNLVSRMLLSTRRQLKTLRHSLSHGLLNFLFIVDLRKVMSYRNLNA